MLSLRLFRPTRRCSSSSRCTTRDYWLGQHIDADPIKDEVRLEVSGIRHRSLGDVARRMRQPLDQMESGGVAAAGFAIVGEFGRPQARIGTA